MLCQVLGYKLLCITKFDSAGKVIVIIIIDPCVYRLYWYLEAYNATSAIVYRILSWSSAQDCLSTISRAAGFTSRHNWPSKFDHCLLWVTRP